MTGVPNGLGALITDARMMGRVDLVISGIVLIAITGLICDRLLVLAMQAVSRSARRL